jgi:hypothetical protein
MKFWTHASDSQPRLLLHFYSCFEAWTGKNKELVFLCPSGNFERSTTGQAISHLYQPQPTT